MQQCRELGRKAVGDSLVVGIPLIKGNTGFGGVGYDKFKVGIFGQLQEAFVIFKWIDSSLHRSNQLGAGVRLPIFNTLKLHVIQTVLLVQHIYQSVGNRLYNRDRTIKVSLTVYSLDHPVNEGAQEIPFSKLYNFGRSGVITFNCLAI